MIDLDKSAIDLRMPSLGDQEITRTTGFGRITAGALLVTATLSLGACAHPPGPTGHSSSQPVDRRAMDHHFKAPEALAQEWNDPSRHAWQKPKEILDAMAIEPGATVADLGAGTGYLIEPLAAAVGEDGLVVALDVEPAMLEFLEKRRSEEQWSNVEVRKSAHHDPYLSAASVDAIVTLNTWHHVDGRRRFAEKLYAALKDGGRFVVVDFIAESTEGRGPPLEMRLAPTDVVRELEAAGFSAEIRPESLPRHYIVVATRNPG